MRKFKEALFVVLSFAVVGLYGGPVNAAGICGVPRIDCDTGHVEPASKIVIPETQLTFSAVTTNNVSITKHGFCPLLPNDAAKYLDGTGAWSTPAGGGGTVPSGTGWRHVTSGVEDGAASTPTYSQVGADQAGAAASAQATAESYADGILSTHAGLTTTAHGGLVPSSAVGAANGVAALGTDSKVSITALPTGTGTSHVITGGDTRLSDARAPTGDLTSAGAVKLYQGTGTSTLTSVALSSTPRIEVAGVTEAMQSLTDNTTGNVSTAAHGYAPKLPNDATKYMDGTGAWSVPSASAAALAKTFYTSGSATHTFNAATHKFLIELYGGGGGGGGAPAATGYVGIGGGGGSGGYLMAFKSIVSGTASISVGAGGTGVSGSAGNSGGSTTFTYNSVTYTVYGGLGGSYTSAASGSAAVASHGGGGTTPSGGDLNATGKPGGYGLIINGTVFYSGAGGTCTVGGSSGGRSTDGDGGTPIGYCTGGAGAAATGTTARAGGTGAGGLVIITEWT